MHQEATDKFFRLQRHELVPVIPVVFVVEPDLVVLDVDNALVADRDAMGVSSQIADNAVCLCQAIATVYHPLSFR